MPSGAERTVHFMHEVRVEVEVEVEVKVEVEVEVEVGAVIVSMK